MFLGDADAGVGDFDAHIIARRHDRGAQRDWRRRGFVGGADGDGAALGHGVARIDDQIDDGVGELRLVGMHRPKLGAVLELQAHVFAQQVAQHQRQFAHHVAHRQHAWLQRLLAREGEKLAHQRRGAQRVLVDFIDLLERRIARLVAHQEKFANCR